MTTVPTKITDKNGKQTTVHKKVDSAAKGAAREIPQAPKSLAEQMQWVGATIGDTKWADEADKAVEYVRYGQPGYDEYMSARKAIDEHWKEYLYSDIASGDYSPEVHEAIYQYAYSEAHSSGRQEIEGKYQDISGIIDTVLRSRNEPDATGKDIKPNQKVLVLDGNEAWEAISNLEYVSYGKPGYDEYQSAKSEIESAWKETMLNNDGFGLSAKAQEAVFEEAWEQGHSSGYSEVEVYFSELANLARNAIRLQNEADKKS
jgi:hypothetical protein